jgi:hypothetical protein
LNNSADSQPSGLTPWLTLSEAAKLLADVRKCEVTEAGILRFALYSNLKLSVRFVNEVKVAKGKYFPILGGRWREVFDDRHLTQEVHSISHITGVFGLPLRSIDGEKYGGNWRSVEREHCRLIGGPEVIGEDCNIEVVSPDGERWLLQQGISCIACDDDLSSYRKELKQLVDEKKITKKIASDLFEQHREMTSEFYTKLISAQHSGSLYYYPAKSLPHDSTLVVQTKDLIEFEPRIDALNYINRVEDKQQTDSQHLVVNDRQQQRLDDLQEYIEFLKSAAKARSIDFDALDLPITQEQLFNELKKRHSSFKKIRKDQFEDDWKVAKDRGICANQRARGSKGEIFLKEIYIQ